MAVVVVKTQLTTVAVVVGAHWPTD